MCIFISVIVSILEFEVLGQSQDSQIEKYIMQIEDTLENSLKVISFPT